MPPKGRKSLSNVWYNCDDCGVVLTQKDMQSHKNLACPADCVIWSHGFIKDKILYSLIEDVDLSDVPDVGLQEKHFFVFVSHSAMQMCHFEIGEDVLVVIDEQDSTVRKVWPTSERSLVSVIFPKEKRLGSKNTSVPESKRVKVQKLPRKPFPASHINLITKEDNCSSSIEHLLIMCKQKYTGKLLQPNKNISVRFYGKDIVFVVKDILSNCKEENVLTDQLEALSVDETKHEQFYYLVVESTNWEIVLNINKTIPETKGKLVNFKTVGGYNEIKEELLRAISNVLETNDSERQLPDAIGVLLHGPNGVGKTFLVQALCNEVNCHVVKIITGELFSKFYGETETRLRSLFNEAKQKAPSIIVIDNVETLSPKRGGTEQERRVIAYLLVLLDSLKHFRTVVVATTSQLNLVDSTLRRPGRLDWEVELHIPSVTDRYEILKVLLSNWTIGDTDIKRVASASHGYVAADLECLVAKAAMQATSQNKTKVDASNLVWALSQVKPSAMREVFIQVPNVKWSDIGGMDDLKLKLKQAIDWPLSHPEAFARLGISPPRGVLMYGPPGCSKTMIAKALATESKLNFLSIKGSELFSKWVGESEKAVQSLFRKARVVAPSIVFLDELDAIGGERSGSTEGSSVQERVLAQLLTEMDGVEPLGHVNIVAATNRPDRVDKALLRPGRLDRLVYVPLPDLSTRECILKLQLAKMSVASNVLADKLALKTEGYSGAEIVAVCHEAALSALQEDLNIIEVCARHFEFALSTVKPRTPFSLLSLYETYSNSQVK